MLQYYIALFGVCLAAFQNARSVRVVQHFGNEVIPNGTFSEDKTLNHMGPEDARVVLHVIGDTHGDTNYLLRCLESTGRIEIESSNGSVRVRWALDMVGDELWEIVILGDVIDIGVRSRENLLILKSLADDALWGKRLVVLLGSHESLLLSALPDYADGPVHWSHQKRLNDLSAKEGSEGHSLVSWLRQRPVVYFSHGLLMMHGGLAKARADQVAEEIGCQRDCGHAMQDFINNVSRGFYDGLHQFHLSDTKDIWKWSIISTLPDILSDSYDTASGPGVLWYSGFSSNERGVGSERICLAAEQVGAYFGSNTVMVVAHTTHPRIMQFCKNFGVPIFAVDTHPSECSKQHDTECDFDVRHDAHPKYKEHAYDRTYQLPQSLKMTQSFGTREFAACQEREHKPYCTVLRAETLSDLPMGPEGMPSDTSAVRQTREFEEKQFSKSSGGPRERTSMRSRSSGDKPLETVDEAMEDLDVLADSGRSWYPWFNVDDVDSVARGDSVAILTSLRIGVGTGTLFETIFEELARGVRAHAAGVTCYQLVRSQTDETAYEVIEIYRDLDALKSHVAQPYVVDGGKKLTAFLLAKPEVKTFSALGTNGGSQF